MQAIEQYFHIILQTHKRVKWWTPAGPRVHERPECLVLKFTLAQKKEVMPWLPTKTHTKSACKTVRVATLHYEIVTRFIATTL